MSDLFLRLSQSSENPLLRKLATNPEFQKESVQRKELLTLFDDIFQNIPDATIDFASAREQGLIKDEQLTALYQQLTDFLSTDPNNARIILYLPFELLPKKDNERNISEELSKVQEYFIDHYLQCWYQLLNENELRSSYIDGDILEAEYGENNLRVVKAAHLLPILIEKNILSVAEIISILENTNDHILQESLLDALVVLADKKLLSQSDWQKLHLLNEVKLADLEKADRSDRKIIAWRSLEQTMSVNKAILTENDSSENAAPSLNELIEKLTTDRQKVITRYEQMSIPPKLTARFAWEKKQKIEKTLKRSADELARHIVSGQIELAEANQLIHTDKEPSSLVGIMAIGEAVLQVAKENLPKAAEISRQLRDSFLEAWKNNSAYVKDELISLLSRWKAAGIIDEAYITPFGISLPKLDQTNEPTKTESEDINQLITAIEQDQALSQMVYPVCLAYGSRIKGYSRLEADSDRAIFIKPDATWKERTKLLNRLKEISPEEMTEFWLQEAENKLVVRNDLPTEDIAIAKQDRMHVLFQGIWFGKKEAIQEIQNKLLAWYLETRAMPNGKTRRADWLFNLEQEALQYRLMHKGYSRFYPPQGGMETEHSHLIDSQSAFWDSGYRRLATKLFLKKVFLPSLPSSSEK